ncbi:hypothetical protein Gpo141_00014617 [Globisporangium polare]
MKGIGSEENHTVQVRKLQCAKPPPVRLRPLHEESFENLFALSHTKNMANYTNIDTLQQLLPVREATNEKVAISR